MQTGLKLQINACYKSQLGEENSLRTRDDNVLAFGLIQKLAVRTICSDFHIANLSFYKNKSGNAQETN